MNDSETFATEVIARLSTGVAGLGELIGGISVDELIELIGAILELCGGDSNALAADFHSPSMLHRVRLLRGLRDDIKSLRERRKLADAIWKTASETEVAHLASAIEEVRDIMR